MAKDFAYFKNKAKLAFNKRQYLRVLEILSYAHLLLENLSDKESLYIKMLSALSDMALDYEDEARALFEYYQVTHIKNNQEVAKVVLGMVENFDKNLYALNLAIWSLQEAEIDKNDGILYEDFETHSAKVGFKEAFEDLMFSSKIIFTNKSEFLFFVRNLVKFGFEDVAINYFENSGNLLFYDRDFMRLYRKILQGKKL
ncbi:hypothetical protein [Helicobacter sp. MIT 05-5294]|uniref:hypothetical protein n=1 Tax=Helicobacter sp. MIT 05-5294 TaxID=1548150 RepID=UPI00051F93EE|nr:hypothetical protein [Helicobacter sp. MIT 05-5294]TLD86077.1 hypothetical protein LS69_007170 [Helicobacter sp. MIT 05-5294]